MSDNDFDDVNCDEYEYESFLNNEYNQDAPNTPQDPVISEEDDNSEKENLSQSRRPICCRCQKVFGKDTDISTLKRHLSSAHKITIENVKHMLKTQSVLNFKRIDPWPKKEKSERDNAVVEWIIGDAQPFRTVENL
ncbi:hypothetical protein GLOIN_2v1777166 [Rhizophagus clarus]|uniref:BED-type domain-containing protein n=1 Tax=Rhizophagus clarus TaxID=94130 RepID=A0A8H3QG66_9GLOM|nr:hypothetical protein GLOIN_2v1777166 [Rhizophagus clarus]